MADHTDSATIKTKWEVDEGLPALAAQGKGTLIVDGATGQRGEQYVNVYLLNKAGAIFVDMANFGHRSKTAEVLANFVKDSAGNMHVAGKRVTSGRPFPCYCALPRGGGDCGAPRRSPLPRSVLPTSPASLLTLPVRR